MMASAVRLWAPNIVAIAVVATIAVAAWGCGSRAVSPATPVPPHPPTSPVPTPPARIPEPSPPTAAPTPAPVPQIEAESNDCVLIGDPGEPIATVAVRDIIDPAHAPRPTNDGERLVFRQIYETLLRIDCHGRPRRGLAASWRLGADGATWLVTLREDARFADGAPVTAADVRAAWTGGNAGEEMPEHVSRLLRAIVAVDDRVLAITLRTPRTDAPLALAHPDLAVARAVSNSPWPLGTRVDRAAAGTAQPLRTGTSEITVTRDQRPPIRFLQSSRDTRDLLDSGVDLLVTRDPATLDYAATLPQFRAVPLDWRHTHVLATPGRDRAAPSLSARDRQVLADDAVRGEARGAAEPFWWLTLEGCSPTAALTRDRSTLTPRIVYDASDTAARDLAERLVGLARVSSPAATAMLGVLLPDRPRAPFQRAVGLTGEPLATAWRRGADAGYIVRVDRQPLDACREMDVTIDGAPWLDPATLIPLVDTRLQAIVRRARTGVTAEGDGALAIGGSTDAR